MAALTVIVEGTITPLTFKLMQGNSPINLTGAAVTLLLTGADGVDVPTAGNITITDASNGFITYTPDSSDLVAANSPYKGRFKIIILASTTFVPNGYRDEWVVVRA